MSLALMLPKLLMDESRELRFDIVLRVLMLLAELTEDNMVSTVLSCRP
jgi:hypothetical protein